jgi:hypothetical protein
MFSARSATGLCAILVCASREGWHSLRRIWPELICPGMAALFVLKASLHEY